MHVGPVTFAFPQSSMAIIEDIPFECLPISLIAMLSTLNSQFFIKGLREFSARDVGWEIYRFLCSLNDIEKVRAICNLQHGMSWNIISSVLKTIQLPVPYWNIYVLPPATPIHIYAAYARYDATKQITVNSAATIDVLKPVPVFLNGMDTISLTPEAARERIDQVVENVVKENGLLDATCSWTSGEFNMYMVNLQLNQLYCFPYFTCSKDIASTIPVNVPYVVPADSHVAVVTKLLVDANLCHS